MTRWSGAPLLAIIALGTSGWLNALEAGTRASAVLAESSREAPITTRAAAREVAHLPRVAELTGRQAEAFETLADALDDSAARVTELNENLEGQVAGLAELGASLRDAEARLPCISARLSDLVDITAAGPELLDSVERTLRSVMRSQRKSLAHLRSINRKLFAFGVVATATGVRPPRRPRDVTPDKHRGDALRPPC